jgi:hypothetical protein
MSELLSFQEKVQKESIDLEILRSNHPDFKLPILKENAEKQILYLKDLVVSGLISSEFYKKSCNELQKSSFTEEELQTVIRHCKRQLLNGEIQ